MAGHAANFEARDPIGHLTIIRGQTQNVSQVMTARECPAAVADAGWSTVLYGEDSLKFRMQLMH